MLFTVCGGRAQRVEFVICERNGENKYKHHLCAWKLFFFLLLLHLLFRLNQRGGYSNSSYAVEAKFGADVSNGLLNEHRDRLSVRLHRISDFSFYRSLFRFLEYAALIRPLSRSFDSLGSQWWGIIKERTRSETKKIVLHEFAWMKMKNVPSRAPTI